VLEASAPLQLQMRPIFNVPFVVDAPALAFGTNDMAATNMMAEALSATARILWMLAWLSQQQAFRSVGGGSEGVIICRS
jgi:hypothetical protein